MRSSYKPDPYILLSAALMALSFPPWDLFPLIWVSFIPAFFALDRAKDLKQTVIQGAWLSYFSTLAGYYWVGYALKEFGNLPWVISILSLQIFSLFGQPQFFFMGILWKLLVRKKDKLTLSWLGLIAFTLLYTGLDWILPKLFVDTLGQSFYKATYLRQLADLGGPYLLTSLLVLVNLVLWKAAGVWIFVQNRRYKTLFAYLIPGALIVVYAWSYGFHRLREIQGLIANAKEGLQAAAIQANIGDIEKLASERGLLSASNNIIDTYSRLTDEALQQHPKPDLIIWPETSYPSTFRNPRTTHERNMDERVEKYVQKIQTPLLFGGYDRLAHQEFNSFFFLQPSGQLQTYHKSILLLFGEYIPGAESIALIRDSFPQVGNFGRGEGPTTFSLATFHPSFPVIHVSPLICYEVLFTNFVAEAARKGSQVLLNITNDSWFGNWGEPQEHLALASFRSIETRLPLLRATNTGISALILPDGEITHATAVGAQTIMKVFVPILEPIPTLIKRWGDWYGPFSLLVGFFLGGGIALTRRRRTF